MPQERDVDELYEPWDVLIKGLRVGELNVGFTSDAESQDPKAPAFQILLGVSDSSENDEERIAIVGQFSMSTEYAYIKVTCLAPLLVRGDLSSDLNTTEGRRRVLKKYSGFALDSLWDFCRMAAKSAVAGSFSGFDIPGDMPDPSLIDPIVRTDDD